MRTRVKTLFINEAFHDLSQGVNKPSKDELMLMSLSLHSQLHQLTNTAEAMEAKQEKIIQQLTEARKEQATNFETVF